MTYSEETSNRQQFLEEQYKNGETKGPIWYQMLGPYIKTREDVAFELVTKYLKKNRISKGIDLGCGEGFLVRRLSSFADNMVGVDLARNRIDLAKKMSKNYKNISYDIVDLNKQLPYKNNSFDLALCVGVLDYIIDPYFSMGEISRILRTGGTCVVSVHNLAFLPERIKLLFGGLPNWPKASGWQGGKLHDFTLPTLVGLMRSEGFEVVKKTGSGFMQQFRSWWPSLLCGSSIVLCRKR